MTKPEPLDCPTSAGCVFPVFAIRKKPALPAPAVRAWMAGLSLLELEIWKSPADPRPEVKALRQTWHYQCC